MASAIDRVAGMLATVQRRLASVEHSAHVHRGGFTTAGRPNAAVMGLGAQIYDKTLHRPLWSDGAVWRDATGAAV